MGGDDTVGTLVVEAAQYRLGNGASDEGLGTAAKLIDEDQAASIRLAHHVLHVQQVTAVGAEVVLDALLIADINEYAVEDTCYACPLQGNVHAALQHVLQEADSLQTHRFASGIRARNDEYSLFAAQLDVERYHLLSMLG